MDLKGIAWAGNIYQKFEAMCVEVEEVMYQDTVKYLENQVQTVGSSVKKFYSEVMQDILPPDYVDPVKVAAADLPLNPYSHTEVNNKKPKVTMKQDLENLRKKKYEDYKVGGDINAEQKESVAKLDYAIDLTKGDIDMRVFSNSYSRAKRGAGLYRRHSANSKENYKIEIPYKMSKETNLGSDILSKATSFYQLSKESETSLASGGVYDAKDARFVDNSACTSAAHVDSRDSSVNLSNDIKEPNLVIQPGTSKETNLGLDILSKATSFCQLSKESETCSASGGVYYAKEARLMDNSACTSIAQVDPRASGVNLSSDIKDPSLVIVPGTSDTDLDSKHPARIESNTDMICLSVQDKAVISSEGRSDDSVIDKVGNDVELEIIRLDESTFEDTCVLVEGNELQAVPQKKGKSKSYKKKFQEAFPLRMKSTRKQEYKKLAAQHCAHPSKQEGMNQNDAEGVPDSEWELL